MNPKLRNPWIDRRVLNVRVPAMRDYMARHAWRLVPYSRPEVLMFEGPPSDNGRPIRQMVPLLEDADDYSQCVVDLITNLALLEHRTAIEVLDEMLGVTTPSTNGPVNSIVAGTPANSPTA